MIVLDYRDKRPLYEQVCEKLKHLIVCGALEPNSKLPSVRSLAMDLSINPNTIQRAYVQLEQEGYIYTVVGRGNFVTDSQEWLEGRLKAIEEELSAQIKKAKASGLTKDTLLRLIESIYMEGVHGESAHGEGVHGEGVHGEGISDKEDTTK